MDYSVSELVKHSDDRGYLVEFLGTDELVQENREFGQIYYVTFRNRHTIRGNHFHNKTEEWLGVLFGTVMVVLEDVETKERMVMELKSSENEFARLRIGKRIAHAFKCLSDTAILLGYANRQYDPGNTDRFLYLLLEK
ncbi:MAG: WxcM-like domain-containing protein [Deltaproteobacteria bacterium]|nr:WxcM-like domain-containing protein [Deltaproteobacteria bacterium]